MIYKKNFFILSLICLSISPCLSANVLPSSQQAIYTPILDKYIAWAKDSTTTTKKLKLKNTRFCGWSAHPLLSSLNDAYLLSGNKKYLEDFSYFYQDLLSYRGDICKLVNYEGHTKPQWYRLDSFDIFHVSPYYPYPLGEMKKTMSLRGWKSTRFSDVNYDGLFLEQMLRFSKIVKEHKIQEFSDIAKEITIRAAETIHSHELEWIEVTKDDGFYIFPKNSPFFLDGVEMPINEAAIFGSALVWMYELTNEIFYLNRAKAMVNHWCNHVKYENGCACYPYVIGAWYNGWEAKDNVSINTPSSLPNTVAEAFHKTALTIAFLKKLQPHYKEKKVSQFLNGLQSAILKASSLPSNHISFFPSSLDFTMPTDSYSAHPPLYFRGWIEISKNNEELWKRMYLLSYVEMQTQFNQVPLYLAALVNRPDSLASLPQVMKDETTISPHLEGTEIKAETCLFNAKKDTVIILSFKHLTPKNNRLFISPADGFSGRGIRLEVSDGVFNGKAFFKKGDCVNWRWNIEGNIKHGQPSSQEENKILMELYTIR